MQEVLQMNKGSSILDKISGKVDLKMILTLLNAIMGVLRSLIKAKQGDTTVDTDVIDH